MSESMRIERRKTMMIFNNVVGRGPAKPDAFPTYDLYNNFRVGAVENGILPLESPVVPAPVYNLTGELLRTLNLLLSYAATNNLGPTKSSRLYYLWFFSVATAYQWATPLTKVNGLKDRWDWSIRHSVGSEKNVCIWMLSCLEVLMTKFPLSPVYEAPWAALASVYSLSSTDLEAAKTSVQATGAFPTWIEKYETWWIGRAADGSGAAVVPPPDSELPNGATRLDVGDTVDPSVFPHPESWTPLKIGTNSQKYMTYNWNNVASAALTPTNQTAIYAAANTQYPSTVERETEIGEVVSITGALTDAQKVSAEFWAGGPFTVSPPGMLIWLWKYAFAPIASNAALFVYSGLDLSLHLFETGRIVWGLKKAHMQARPIQEIRRLYRGASVNKYDGSTIQGQQWVPYQESNFVTPPFADFPSGHSAFSRSFANVMTRWFGTRLPRRTVDFSDIALISPALVRQTRPYGSIVFGAGASLIQRGVVPAAPVSLTWTTWAEMAESAGISRKYGGIHATSAHTGSVLAADALHSVLLTNFPIIATV